MKFTTDGTDKKKTRKKSNGILKRIGKVESP
jgi:hypothetical protein